MDSSRLIRIEPNMFCADCRFYGVQDARLPQGVVVRRFTYRRPDCDWHAGHKVVDPASGNGGIGGNGGIDRMPGEEA
jgi:hypothetical protein